ncbi:hypothetical protein JAAARDRAFT_198503 [Jaapia argillacea MUCL 33604]|uniref:CHAT domain-containing protein n=1 Tax=Jaapia argillacea MUCL 33604 TaxID=933084 RepID=A0A067PE16_9AGAM|nr:hypothetical protein JAAARDRAFT_198503 [Jaapia argillacea MUCL 33604]
MDPHPVIHLTDFTIMSSHGEHSSLLDNAQIFLQLTLDGDVVYETLRGEREPNKQVWRVHDCVNVPDSDDISLFSITVMLDSASHITTQIGSVDLTSQDISAKGQTLKITRNLVCPNIVLEFSVGRGPDGSSSPLSPKSAHCEPDAATGTPLNTDVDNKQTPLSDDERISSLQINDDLDFKVLDSIYASTLVEPDVEKRAAMLNELGDRLLRHYQNHHRLESLHRAVSVYADAVQMAAPDSPQKFIYLNDLGTSLQSRFEHLGNITDIDKSILTLQDGVRLTPDGDPNKPGYLNNLSISLLCRFEHLGNITDIDNSIRVQENVVQLTPDGHPNKPGRLNNLGSSLLYRFDRFGNITDIDNSIRLQEDALQLTPDGHPDKPGHLSNLGCSLLRRFERLGNITDINNSIRVQEDAMQLTSDGPGKPGHLNNLGSSLLRRFECLGNITDINNSIRVREDALRLTPDGHPGKPGRLSNLGSSLLRRFERLSNITDIDNSIRVQEDALQLTPDGHPDKPGRLNNLGSSLGCCFERLGNITDINNSIRVREDALQLTPDGHPDKPVHLSNLGSSLLRRFEHLSNITDINNSIRVQEDAVRLTPDGHPDKPGHLNNLGSSLLHRFEHFGNITDIDNSIRVQEDALQLTPDGHPDKPGHLSSLGSSLLRRFEHLGNITNINNSIRVREEAVRLTPDGHPGKPGHLNNLGGSLLRHFEHLGNIADIDNSIRVREDALRLIPDGHPAKPGGLNNLGTSLLRRFERLGNITDIDNSIRVQEDAVHLTPDGHPGKPGHLNNLSSSLLYRFDRLGNITDIDNSIRVQENALQLTPDGHPDKPGYLSNLGGSLLCRFEHLSNITDIDNSIRVREDALQLTPDGHPDKPGHLTNLGGSLLHRYHHLGNITDINKSIRLREDAVRLTPDGHPNKPSYLKNLGNSLLCCFEHLGDQAILALAIEALSTTALFNVGSPSVRFRAGIAWAQQAQKIHHTSLLTAYSTLLTLLPQFAWLGLPMHERHRELTKAGNLARDAASAAIEAGQFETAIEWLEQGRSVVWGQLLQLRTPIDELRHVQPQLAARFTQVSNRLQQTSTPFRTSEASDRHSLEEVAREHRRLTAEWEVILGEIRGIEGFGRFLLPKPFSQLKSAARSGPVIILNMSNARCDALVLMPGLDDVLHIPLPNLTQAVAEALQNELNDLLSEPGRLPSQLERPVRRKPLALDYNSKFKMILARLWSDVVKPVLDALAFTSPPSNPSRIWWCPTGPLAFLPIHAAGIYDAPDPGNCISDFVISSYIPTLSTLIDNPQVTTPHPFQLLAVAQPNAPHHKPLPGTRKELKLIENCAKDIHFVALIDDTATVENVLRHMGKSTWVHFACHGVQDISNPTDSGLILANGSRLKLSEIINLSLSHAELAFLSACETATGSDDLSEEAVHLAAGMLLAGYRGVIATMWTIGDRDAPLIADDVYSHILMGGKPDYTQAALALHQAVRRLRSQGASFLSWVPYIHIGF